MTPDQIASKVQNNINQSLAQLSAGDDDEMSLRRHHPSARYRAPHPVFDLSCSLLFSALMSNASALQLVSAPHSAKVQIEVQGAWKELAILPEELREALMARFKDASYADVTKTGQPQTGNLPVQWQDQEFSLPVSFVPTDNGEQVIIRFVRK